MIMTPSPVTRSTSINERRTSHNTTARPRVASGRVPRVATSRHDSSTSREATPVAGDGPSTTKPMSRDYGASNEVRTEKTQRTTKERVQVRNKRPVKEGSGLGNRGDWEKGSIKRPGHNGTGSLSKAPEKVRIESKASTREYRGCITC